MTIVARKTAFSQWFFFAVAILIQLHGFILLIWFPWTTAQSPFGYFWLLPAAFVTLVGPWMFCIGLTERRKRGIAMFFDREGIYWDWASTHYFWLPFEKHFYRVKWDEMVGVKLLDRKIGDHDGPILLVGVSQCESLSPAMVKMYQEFVLTHLGRQPWKSTLPIFGNNTWLWNPQEVVAQIEQTLGDKSAREQWGDPPR